MKHILFSISLIALMATSTQAFAAKSGFATITFHQKSFERGNQARERGPLMRWRVNGKEFQFTADTVVVKANSELDTIIFFDGDDRTDTILCDLRKNKSYEIEFNTCCGYFNMREKPRTKTGNEHQAVFFQLRKYFSDEPLMVVMGTTGLTISRSAPTQVLERDLFKSAMAPSVENIQITLIENPDDLHFDEEEKVYTHYANKSAILMEFNYIFLHNDQLEVDYNAKEDFYELKISN